MRCESCIALRSEGYEYPESYCAAGVDLDSEIFKEWKDGAYGCTLHPKTVRKRVKEYDEAYASQYEAVGEWYMESMRKETLPEKNS